VGVLTEIEKIEIEIEIIEIIEIIGIIETIGIIGIIETMRDRIRSVIKLVLGVMVLRGDVREITEDVVTRTLQDSEVNLRERVKIPKVVIRERIPLLEVIRERVPVRVAALGALVA